MAAKKHLTFSCLIDVQDFMAIDAFFRRQGFAFAGKASIMRFALEYLAKTIKENYPEYDFELHEACKMFAKLYDNPTGKWNRNALTLVKAMALEEKTLNSIQPAAKMRPNSELVKSVVDSLSIETEKVGISDLSKALARVPALNMEVGDEGEKE